MLKIFDVHVSLLVQKRLNILLDIYLGFLEKNWSVLTFFCHRERIIV